MKRGGRKAEEGPDAKRRRLESLREQYPMVFAFGAAPIKYLSHEEAVAATVQERIRSVWPFLVRQVLAFAETLRPRDLANYDVEDVLGELWVALAEKDAKWDPARGRYLTFAGRVVTNELHALRDRAHTVHSPKNTSCRLKAYRLEDDAGGLSDRRRKTYGDIVRALGEHAAVDADPAELCEPDTADLAEGRESQRRARQAVLSGMAGLSPAESRTLGRCYGLYGQAEQTPAEIADETGRSVEAVQKTRGRAERKVRDRLTLLSHPATEPEGTRGRPSV